MKNGICPKCGSKAVYSGVDVLMKGGGHGSNTIPISTARRVMRCGKTG